MALTKGAVLLLAFLGSVVAATLSQTLLSAPSAGKNSGALDSDWDFWRKPSSNSTDHLVFDTANSFLQRWTATRYGNGHNIVVGSMPVGTLLYHGSQSNTVSPVPDWVATDPDHSMMFCAFMDGDDHGCWHLTFVATRPLKVLYFDGNSAAKMAEGSLDTQDLLVWGEPRPGEIFDEWARINALCDWGKTKGLDGFVRMEMDFEVMLCNFTAGVDVAAVTQHPPMYPDHAPQQEPKTPPPNPPQGNLWRHPGLAPAEESRSISLMFRAIEAGSWHDNFPGETRIHLDYSRILSFYDTDTFPSSMTSRLRRPRSYHRVGWLSTDELTRMKEQLDHYLQDDEASSGFDWRSLLRVVADKFSGRLDRLRFTLADGLSDLRNANSTEGALQLAEKVIRQVRGTIITSIIVLPEGKIDGSSLEWALPVWRLCAQTHTAFLRSSGFRGRLKRSEKLLLGAVDGVQKEICRVLSKIWAEGSQLGIEEFPSSSTSLGAAPASLIFDAVKGWYDEVHDLMAWLDWSEWVRCEPGCSKEEYCYLPTWPVFDGTLQLFPPPITDGEAPTPRCIRSVEPFEI